MRQKRYLAARFLCSLFSVLCAVCLSTGEHNSHNNHIDNNNNSGDSDNWGQTGQGARLGAKREFEWPLARSTCKIIASN